MRFDTEHESHVSPACFFSSQAPLSVHPWDMADWSQFPLKPHFDTVDNEGLLLFSLPPWKIDSNGLGFLWAKATVTGSAWQLCWCSPVEFSSPPDGQSSSINKSVLKIEHFEQWRYSKYLHVSGEWTGKNLQGQVFRKQEEARGVVIWTFEYTQKISLVTFFSLLPKSQCQVSFKSDYFGANLQQRPACLWKSFPHNFQQCPPMGGQWLIIKLLRSRLKSELRFYMHNSGGSKLTNVWVSLFFPLLFSDLKSTGREGAGAAPI